MDTWINYRKAIRIWRELRRVASRIAAARLSAAHLMTTKLACAPPTTNSILQLVASPVLIESPFCSNPRVTRAVTNVTTMHSVRNCFRCLVGYGLETGPLRCYANDTRTRNRYRKPVPENLYQFSAGVSCESVSILSGTKIWYGVEQCSTRCRKP